MPPILANLNSPPGHSLSARWAPYLTRTHLSRSTTFAFAPGSPKITHVDARSFAQPLQPKPLNRLRAVIRSLSPRTLGDTITPAPPKEKDQPVVHYLRRSLEKRWACSAEYSSSCATHRIVVLVIVIVVLLLMGGLATLVVLRHRKRRAEREAEIRRVQEQVDRQMAERAAVMWGQRVNGYDGEKKRIWSEVGGPPAPGAADYHPSPPVLGTATVKKPVPAKIG